MVGVLVRRIRHDGGGDRNHRPGKGESSEGERPVNKENVGQSKGLQPRVEIDRSKEVAPQAEVEKPKEQRPKPEAEKPKAEGKSKTEKPKPEGKKDDPKAKGE